MPAERLARPFRTPRRLLAAVACGTIIASTLVVGSAHAAPRSIGTLRTRVHILEQQLANQESASAALAQQYDRISERLLALEAHQRVTEHRVVVVRTRIKRTRRELDHDALLSYVFGSNQSRTVSLFDEGANEAEAATVYQETAIGDISAVQAQYENELVQLSAIQTNLGAQHRAIAKGLHQSYLLRQRNQVLALHTSALVRSMGRRLRHLVLLAAIAAARAAAAAREAAAAGGAAGVAAQLGGAAGLVDALQGFSGQINGTATGNAAGMAAFAAAKSQIGVPYVWGGETPNSGFDCSGLTQWSWAQAGVSIPRTAAEQYDALPHVSLEHLQPGDLLFYFNLDGDDQVDHVVMYGGSGPYGTQTTIAAAYTGTDIELDPAFTFGLIGAGRP